MSNQNSVINVSTMSLLGIAFVVLKLCGVIDWSWWWVTAPFWGPLALLLALAIVFLLCAGVVMLFVAVVSFCEERKLRRR